MSIFSLVVRRARWVARIPLMPQLFDSLLLAWNTFVRPDLVRAMEAVEEAVLAMPGVCLNVHRLGGVGFNRGGREIGHMHGNGLLDLHAGRALAQELVGARLAENHHVFSDSAWVSFWVRSTADVARAIALFRLVEARPAQGIKE